MRWGTLTVPRAWFLRAVDAGSSGGMYYAGALAEEVGDRSSAVLWWQRSADAGNLAAMWRLGNLAEEAGDVEGARAWYEQATHGGSGRARDRLRSSTPPETLLRYMANPLFTSRCSASSGSRVCMTPRCTC